MYNTIFNCLRYRRTYTHGQKVKAFVNQVSMYDAQEQGTYARPAKKNTWKYNWMVIELKFDEEEGIEYYAVNMEVYTPGLNEEGNLYELTSANSKDLEKMAAANELIQISFLAKKLSSEFSPSEVRSKKVAKLIVSYNKLGNKRALTDADCDIFTKSLFGHDYKTVESALMKKMSGDDSDYEGLLEKSALLNNITPEHLNSLFETFVK
ncbi:hypothetical protein OAK75_08555 [Bacteriovoracales bacterium]|nr:hypothetical protein [Bacteriovoracales bacterium]